MKLLLLLILLAGCTTERMICVTPLPETQFEHQQKLMQPRLHLALETAYQTEADKIWRTELRRRMSASQTNNAAVRK